MKRPSDKLVVEVYLRYPPRVPRDIPRGRAGRDPPPRPPPPRRWQTPALSRCVAYRQLFRTVGSLVPRSPVATRALAGLRRDLPSGRADIRRAWLVHGVPWTRARALTTVCSAIFSPW